MKNSILNRALSCLRLCETRRDYFTVWRIFSFSLEQDAESYQILKNYLIQKNIVVNPPHLWKILDISAIQRFRSILFEDELKKCYTKCSNPGEPFSIWSGGTLENLVFKGYRPAIIDCYPKTAYLRSEHLMKLAVDYGGKRYGTETTGSIDRIYFEKLKGVKFTYVDNRSYTLTEVISDLGMGSELLRCIRINGYPGSVNPEKEVLISGQVLKIFCMMYNIGTMWQFRPFYNFMDDKFFKLMSEKDWDLSRFSLEDRVRYSMEFENRS